ncbi:MBL fold metallo-hydrolase [bacterium]|nr:MBL fold metallo-hydrolase [bacterium]
MHLYVLASGSKANSVLLRDGNTRILIDAGLGIRKMTTALESIGEYPQYLNAIFITHEHADHTRCLNRLAPYAKVKVYGSLGTLMNLEGKAHAKQELVAMNGDVIQVGPFSVTAIPVTHDAAEPTAFHITTERERITIATDLGEVPEELSCALMHSTCAVLESNHDEDLLESGPYPQLLKDRIRSSLGHLSNKQTAEALTVCKGNGLRHVILAHISEENNDPLLARASAEQALAGTDTQVYLTAQQTVGPFLDLTKQ